MDKTTYAELEDLTETCTAWRGLKRCTTRGSIDFSSSVRSQIPGALGNKAREVCLLTGFGGMPPSNFLDFRPSEIVSGAMLEWNNEPGIL